jgi:FkbH-like protein
MITSSDLKAITALLDEGRDVDAWIATQDLWRRFPNLTMAGFVKNAAPRFARFMPREHRLYVLRSFTVEPILALLEAGAALAGIKLTTGIGEFNAIAQEVFNPTSALYASAPQTVILAQQTRDVSPYLWSCVLPDQTAIDEEVARITADYRRLIDAFRDTSAAALLIHGLEQPAYAASGALDAQRGPSQAAGIAAANAALAALCREYRDVYVLDYDALVARHGRLTWADERKWLTARLPIAAPCLPHMAQEWLRFLIPLSHATAKVLVLDLDNTCWGGVIGEDGMAGIKLGGEYPGAAFVALQRAALDLYGRGVVLAACSKNNLADAMEVIETHPEMLLRPHHFGALRINWTDKAENLRAIAEELNLGLDSLVFVDDNPVERERVRQALPQVRVLDMPPDPMDYAAALRACPWFEQLSLSDEDRERGRYYTQERERRELADTAGGLDGFLRSLEITAEIADVDALSLARAAQLTQKTNQFNLTTRRYGEEDIAAMMASDRWIVRTLKAKDRLGDSGIVCVGLVEVTGETARIDTLLMSCRVIGRGMETAFLADLIAAAKDAGARAIEGVYMPTAKNALCADFYAEHGFERVGEGEGSGVCYRLDIAASTVETPEWIAVG